MAAPVQVRKVESKADFTAFFEFPWTLYKDDPNWTPPLLSMRRDLLDKKKNPAWDYMEGDYFVAWRGSQPVGTIAAFINHHHNEYHNERVGWFGAFEVYDDAEAATALLEVATNWVNTKGDYNKIYGPQTFTTHEDVGVLIENFSPAILLMPYNPPYYQRLIESAGFGKTVDLKSVYFDRVTLREEYLNKLVDRAAERNHITVRPIDLKRKKEEFRLFRDIYNAAWERNWGFVPMTDKELDALVDGLGFIFEPSMAYFAEVKGEPAAFALAVPDLNDALRRAYPRPGEPEPWTLVKTGWHWKVRPIIRGVRLPLMGVVEKHRNKGLELAMFKSLFASLKPGPYQYLDAGWILETNKLLTISDKIGGNFYKTHRLYEKALS
jgi:hypothetical protein